jgi:hypothetical protein
MEDDLMLDALVIRMWVFFKELFVLAPKSRFLHILLKRGDKVGFFEILIFIHLY